MLLCRTGLCAQSGKITRWNLFAPLRSLKPFASAKISYALPTPPPNLFFLILAEACLLTHWVSLQSFVLNLANSSLLPLSSYKSCSDNPHIRTSAHLHIRISAHLHIRTSSRILPPITDLNYDEILTAIQTAG
jgi:hypothetical protein